MATRVKYVGPEPAVNRDVGRETGGGDLLKHGKVYEVSAELADSLLEGAMWERPKAKAAKSTSSRRRSSSSTRAAADPAGLPAGDGADSVPGDTVEGDKKP